MKTDNVKNPLVGDIKVDAASNRCLSMSKDTYFFTFHN